ncbi:hypothetical protein FHS38_003955 [Streptomyces netropsis]|uniref:Uncharacterized protein n=1 Tax=Streptomyces netropsis TaxID=55404 RepID=A0A7W7LDE9_STRNE|nr:hypothetical protein [Streptomyces netropsis]
MWRCRSGVRGVAETERGEARAGGAASVGRIGGARAAAVATARARFLRHVTEAQVSLPASRSCACPRTEPPVPACWGWRARAASCGSCTAWSRGVRKRDGMGRPAGDVPGQLLQRGGRGPCDAGRRWCEPPRRAVSGPCPPRRQHHGDQHAGRVRDDGVPSAPPSGGLHAADDIHQREGCREVPEEVGDAAGGPEPVEECEGMGRGLRQDMRIRCPRASPPTARGPHCPTRSVVRDHRRHARGFRSSSWAQHSTGRIVDGVRRAPVPSMSGSVRSDAVNPHCRGRSRPLVAGFPADREGSHGAGACCGPCPLGAGVCTFGHTSAVVGVPSTAGPQRSWAGG